MRPVGTTQTITNSNRLPQKTTIFGFCYMTFQWRLNVLFTVLSDIRPNILLRLPGAAPSSTPAIDAHLFCQLHLKKKQIVSPNPKLNTAIYRWRGKHHAFILGCSANRISSGLHFMDMITLRISAVVNAAHHEGSFLLFLILVWKMHFLEKLQYSAALVAHLFVQAGLGEFEHFCETTMIPQLWILFQSSPARAILFCFRKNMVYLQRVKTVCGSTVAWKTICQEIKEIKNSWGLLFFINLSLSDTV